MSSQKLTALQLELLNIYSFEPSEEDLLAIKQLLAKYFSDKLLKNVQQAIQEKGITEEDVNPRIIKGDKSIDPKSLFGIWENNPRSLEDIRKAGWQRKS